MRQVQAKFTSVARSAIHSCGARLRTPCHSSACPRVAAQTPVVLTPRKKSHLRVTTHGTATSACQQLKATSPHMTIPPADLHVQQAWEFWQRIGAPKFHVAPMVDQVQTCAAAADLPTELSSITAGKRMCCLQSELAFRLLCFKHGATAAYTPMLHSRLFLEDPKYRAEHFTTTAGDRYVVFRNSSALISCILCNFAMQKTGQP